jgi:predicted amidohydrolase
MKYFVLLAVLFLAALGVTGTSVTYNAAVVEYTALYSPTVVTTREEALSIEFGNLIIMESYMKQAKAKGVQIIVFPEYGVYGATPFETRDDVLPFLEPVPDPAQSETVLNPCNYPSEFPQSQLLVKASCLAASQKMALVMNMGSVEYCNATNPPAPDCPRDGRFQYNTEVAFDEFGALVGRYRKFHLYYEPWFDSPPTPDVS